MWCSCRACRKLQIPARKRRIANSVDGGQWTVDSEGGNLLFTIRRSPFTVHTAGANNHEAESHAAGAGRGAVLHRRRLGESGQSHAGDENGRRGAKTL